MVLVVLENSISLPGLIFKAFMGALLPYFAALAARMASMSMGVTLNRSPQMP